MKPGAATEPHRLKFHWPPRPRISLALVGFLFISVLAHGVAFYILQVVDPPVVVITPPPVQVNLLTPTTPENVALLRWIDANDPAAIANPHEVVPGNIYDLPYQRSSAETRATPKSPDELAAAVPFPTARDAMDVIASAQESPAPPVAKMAPLSTELKFSGGLAGRKVMGQPSLKFNIPGTGDREPVSFLVGVGPDGKVQYTFFMGVETDDKTMAIDRQAEEHLGQVEFARTGGEGTAWGIATYYWGNDTYQAQAQVQPAGAAMP
jgi:hypothetical protein